MSLLGGTLSFFVSFPRALGRERGPLGRTFGHVFAHVSNGHRYDTIIANNTNSISIIGSRRHGGGGRRCRERTGLAP